MRASGLRRSSKIRQRLRGLMIAVAFLIVTPSAALGIAPPGPVTINFDGVTVGASPSSVSGASFSPGVLVVDASGTTSAHSHAAEQCGGSPASCGRGGPFEIAFDQPQSSVELSITYVSSTVSAVGGISTGLSFQLVALDQNGNQVDTGSPSQVSASGDSTTVSVGGLGQGNRINKVRVEWARPAPGSPSEANLPAGVLVGEVAFQADPAPPAVLTITVLGTPDWRRGGHQLWITAHFTNTGKTSSTLTQFNIDAPGANFHYPIKVQPISPGGQENKTFYLTYPQTPTSTSQVTLTLTPASNESPTADSADRAHRVKVSALPPNGNGGFPPPPPPPDGGSTSVGDSTPVGAIAGGSVAGILLAGGALIWLLHRRIPPMERLEWQLKASDTEPPRHCTRGKEICRREGEFDPAARRITKIDCMHDPPHHASLTIRGEAIDRLNSAHAAYLDMRPDEAIAFVVAAQELIGSPLTDWAQGGQSSARLAATIEGSKGKGSFKLLRCTEGEKPPPLTRLKHALGLDHDDHSPWRELAHWDAEIEDVTTIDIGLLDAHLLTDRSRRHELAETLRARLIRLAQDWTQSRPSELGSEAPGLAATDPA